MVVVAEVVATTTNDGGTELCLEGVTVCVGLCVSRVVSHILGLSDMLPGREHVPQTIYGHQI
jgi:hypothetical protein